MRRLPKQRFYRGLMKANMITKKDIPLIERKLADFKRYQKLNITFSNGRGHRWANKLQSFARWLWEHREVILQILGIVIMFAEDGTPHAVDGNEVSEDKRREALRNMKRRLPTKFTPHGEKVEDFTDPADILVAEAQEQGFYDIGLKGADDEVQSGKVGSESVDKLESDDV